MYEEKKEKNVPPHLQMLSTKLLGGTKPEKKYDVSLDSDSKKMDEPKKDEAASTDN